MQRHRFSWSVVFGVCAVSFVGAPVASAAIYDSQGFEAPPFIAGADLFGQDPVDGPWTTTLQVGSSSYAEVTSNVGQPSVPVESGTQSVELYRSGMPNNDTVRYAPYVDQQSVNGTIEVNWDLYVDQNQDPDVTFGPYFGVEANDGDTSGDFVLVAGSAGIDAATGEFLYQADGTGFLTTVADSNSSTGTVTLGFSAWHSFQMLLDYDSSTYDVYVDGNQLLANEGFVDEGVEHLDDMTDAPLIGLPAAADPGSQATSAYAYFDNYQIVPEPTSMMLMAAGLLAMGRRRRRGV